MTLIEQYSVLAAGLLIVFGRLYGWFRRQGQRLDEEQRAARERHVAGR